MNCLVWMDLLRIKNQFPIALVNLPIDHPFPLSKMIIYSPKKAKLRFIENLHSQTNIPAPPRAIPENVPPFKNGTHLHFASSFPHSAKSHFLFYLFCQLCCRPNELAGWHFRLPSPFQPKAPLTGQSNVFLPFPHQNPLFHLIRAFIRLLLLHPHISHPLIFNSFNGCLSSHLRKSGYLLLVLSNKHQIHFPSLK